MQSMGLYFRKTFTPTRRTRITLSKSGIGWSWGIGPVRFTRNAGGGRTCTIRTPIRGLTYRSTRRR